MKELLGKITQRRIIIPLGLFLVVIILLGSIVSCQPKFLMHQMALHNPEVLFYVETADKVLALTIADSPNSHLTPAILDLLDKYGIPVTFFIIGQQVPGNEHLLQRMKKSGHELGNHMVTDEPSIMLSHEEFAANLLAVEKLIGPLGEKKWCRPGSGWFNHDMVNNAHELGYRFCLGSLYPFDNKVRNPDLIHLAVMEQMYPGAILILHEGGPQRDYIIPLLDELIPDLISVGYKFMTVSELQELETVKPAEPGKTHP